MRLDLFSNSLSIDITLTILFIFVTSSICIAQYEDFSSNLPIVVIKTNGQTIVDENRIIADMGVILNGNNQRNQLNDPFNNYNGKIGIELRGTTSQFFPKKPYRIETVDSLGNDRNVELLGFPKENDWVFYNPFSDKTFLRNTLAYKLSRELGNYSSRTQHFELFINGEYLGIYVLLEKIKRDKNRVDISKLTPTDNSGDEVTGGYILKLDKHSGEEVGGWESGETFYQYHYPKPSEITNSQKTYIQEYIKEFENSVNQNGSNNLSGVYEEYIDLNSFVDFFLINELTKNIDAYRLSSFMYKDRDSKEGKLTMGPIWDFNLSLGNAQYFNGYDPEGWNIDHLINEVSSNDYQVPFWWGVIRNDSTFNRLASERWFALRKNIFKDNVIFSYLDSMATFLDEAQIRNYQKWPVLGEYVWPNWYIGETYSDEIYFLKIWLHARLSWIDVNIKFDSPTSISRENNFLYQNEFNLLDNYPNPFNPSTTIRFSIPKDGLVNVKIFNVLGELVAKEINEIYTAGTNSLKFDANHLASGIFITQITYKGITKRKKMILMK